MTQDLVTKNGKEMGTKLSGVEEAWCRMYFATGDGFKAYNESGFPPVLGGYKALQVKVWRLKTKPKIQARLKEMSEQSLEDLKERRGILIHRLMAMLNADVTDYIDADGNLTLEGEGLDTQVLKKVAVTEKGKSIELHDKVKVAELLARISGLMVDKVDVTSGGKPINQAPVSITFEVVPNADHSKDITDACHVDSTPG